MATSPDLAMLKALPSIPSTNECPIGSEGFLPTWKGQVIQVSKWSGKENNWAFGRVLYDPHAGSIRPGQGWFPVMLSSKASIEAKDKVIKSAATLGVPALVTPADWSPGQEGRVRVPEHFIQFKEVASFFEDSMLHGSHDATIEKLERIQSLHLWQTYAAKKNAMITKYSSSPGQLINNTNIAGLEHKWLFHGTSPSTVPKIVKQGFNRSFNGRNATAFGKGVYFARDASYSLKYSSPNPRGVRQMFICRVAVGDWCKGRKTVLTPDSKPGTPDELFDSTVDTLINPSIFVVYHDAQVYPEYLVSFTTN